MTTPTAPQMDAQGRLRHLLTVDGLPAELIREILDRTATFLPDPGAPPRKVPLLRGATVVNLFFEPSTRTRTTFELAAKRLSADVLTLQMEHSSKTKGEHDLDTLFTMQAMGANIFVIRHPDNGAAAYFADNAAPDVAVLNAGDGSHAHPTQALLDMFTIRRHKPDFTGLRVAIVGDIRHSRVAHSDIAALRTLGVTDIRVVAPAPLLPDNAATLGVQPCATLADGLDDADVVIALRIQHERMQQALDISPADYRRDFGLTADNLTGLKPDALILHPGPINRGVEIDPDIAYGPQSVVLEQVRNGIAVRMAVMAMIVGARSGT
ncbi:MAG: aspartate carbamoyltransferase catalytic subunit [Salinisphaeraceae bacterium]